MPVSEEFSIYVVDQMRNFGNVSVRKMFGGAGLSFQGITFGLIANDVVYLKTDKSSEKKFEELGMGPFYPFEKKKPMPYWEIPVDVLEDHEELQKWCETAFQVAINARKEKDKRSRKSKKKK